VINERRAVFGQTELQVEGWRGSAAVQNPEREFVPGRKNEDYFANAKAQGWFELRRRCQITFRAVTMGAEYNSDDLISFASGMAELQALLTEMSQRQVAKPCRRCYDEICT
jgi:phage terminase large subunit